MAIVKNPNDDSQYIDDQTGAVQPQGANQSGYPTSSAPAIKDPTVIGSAPPSASGPSPYDLAHTPNGPGAPAPNAEYLRVYGPGKTVRNWNDPSQWINDVTGAVQSPPSGADLSKAGPNGGASTFSDPASQQYESQINSLIGRLNQPTSNPGFQPMMDWMTKYFQQQGNGQGYTPDQMAMFQTQALDPLERNRSAAKQRMTEYMASKGMSPSSGPTIQALQAIDQQFETLGQQQRGQIAGSNANLGIQQQQQAASLGPLIASLYQGQTNLGNSNALQAVNLAGLIPAMEQSRIQTAQGVLNPTNPASLFTPLLQAQNLGYTQNADYMQQLTDMLMKLYGGPTH